MDVILGAGPASLAAYHAYRRLRPRSPLTLVYPEPSPYSRAILPVVLAGELPEQALEGRVPADPHLTVLRGSAAVLDPRSRILRLEGGAELSFTGLLIATGSEAFRPPVPGLPSSDVFTLRDREDVLALKKRPAGRAVVIGAGPVGLAGALALRKRGFSVSVVELREQILSEVLDAEAAAIYRNRLLEAGLSLYTGRTLRKVEPGPPLELDVDGETWTADLILLATGVKPRLGFLGKDADSRGLAADRYLQTTWPGIFAAGDVVRVRDRLTGKYRTAPIWPQAVASGRVAGENLAGGAVEYPGFFTRQHPLSLTGLPAVSLGTLTAGPGEEEVSLRPSAQVYRRFVFREERLVGAILVGEIRGAGALARAIERGLPLRPLAGRLLRGEDIVSALVA